jgi:transposase
MWHEGRHRKLYCFALTLGYSRASNLVNTSVTPVRN